MGWGAAHFSRKLQGSVEVDWLDPQIPVSHWAMISLQHERTGWFFVQPMGGASRTRHLHIFLNDLAIMRDADEARVLRFLAAGVKARRAKHNIESLPLARRLAGIDRRRPALEIGLGLAATGIDPAAIPVFGFLHAPTVQHLNLVADRKSTRLNSSHVSESR